MSGRRRSPSRGEGPAPRAKTRLPGSGPAPGAQARLPGCRPASRGAGPLRGVPGFLLERRLTGVPAAEKKHVCLFRPCRLLPGVSTKCYR